MDGVDGASGRKSSPREDDFEKPLPGAARKDAVNIANAPWLADVTKTSPARPPPVLASEIPYPAAIFSNPAMLGRPVSFAPPPPPSAPKPAPLATAPDAHRGIQIATLAEGLPSGTRTDPSRAFTCGAGYKLYPEVAKQPDGTDAIVYWKAFNTEAKRVDFLVGPDSLSSFTRAPSDFATAAANAFMGEQDAATRESMKVVDLAVREGFGPAIGHLGVASKAAWTDPKWVAKTTFQVVSSIGPSTAVAVEARLEARAVAAEAAVGETGATGFVTHVNKDLPLGKTAGDRAYNCANSAVATDATLSGKPASALPGVVTKAPDLAELYGSSWSPPSQAASGIEAPMAAAGPGARGIVLGKYPNEKVGHFFNVVNDGGSVRFVDGQSGTAANLAPFESFWLLRTN